jgi:ectoine hydroxylase-related dioxygenase (phytanoyl-CoA dioxygenase family)
MKNFLNRDGYVIIKNFYNKKLFTQIFLSIDSFFRNSKYKKKYNLIRKKSLLEKINCMVIFLKKKDPQFASFVYRNMPDQLVVYNSINKKLFILISKLFNKKIKDIHFEQRIIRMDPPNSSENLIDMHQDLLPLSKKQLRGELNGLTAWCPLQNINESSGGLAVAPKSHKIGFVTEPFKTGKKYSSYKYKIKETVSKKLTFKNLNMNKGDILIMNTLLIHKSIKNISDKVRYTLQFRFGLNKNYKYI